jgi:oligopeptidase B
MKYQAFSLLGSLIIPFMMHSQIPQPPRPAKKPYKMEIHGHVRVDDYYWMNERDSKEVIDYLNAENAYTNAVLKHTKDFQETLFNEMVGRIKQTDLSVPYRLRGYYYYSRYDEGKEYPIYCRKKGSLDAAEEVMLDVNKLAEGHSYCDVVGLTVSPDNNLLAYGVDFVSRRKYTLYIKNLLTGEVMEKTVENTDGSYVWANDNKTLFYDIKDEVTLRSFKIRRHILGTPASADTDVYEENDETFSCSVYKSKSEEYIFIGSYSTLTSEVRFIKASEPWGEFKIIQPRERDHLYSAEHFEDHFYISTNWNAKNFRLMKTPIIQTGKENWVEVIPHRKDVLIDGFEIFKQYLVLEERQNGLNQLHVKSWDGKVDYLIDFTEPTYSVALNVNMDFDTEVLRYSYTSLITPHSVYDFNMRTRHKTLLKQQEVLGGYDARLYESKRLYATATDGTKIPISLVYKRGIQLDGKNPLLLYGYGSYGVSMDPYFSSARLSLIDRGFIFAIAHIRGGQEMGRQWYEDGKLLKKKNTFTDFIDCALYLIDQKYTSPQHLYCMGGSAGGLLIGAVVNMRPDLFKGAIAQVPFVDVVTTMLDESIPLTTGEFDEWGNPKDKTYYDYMLSYSPYDNVTRQPYPNMLITTGYHDSQVQYFEPAKWVAKLRENNTGSSKILFFCEMEAGHGGKSGRFQRLREIALEYAFLLDLEGISK